MNHEQTAIAAALDTAHQVRDVRIAREYTRRRAEKNRRDALVTDAPSFTKEFLAHQQPDLRKILDEMRMTKWRDAEGEGLRDW